MHPTKKEAIDFTGLLLIVGCILKKGIHGGASSETSKMCLRRRSILAYGGDGMCQVPYKSGGSVYFFEKSSMIKGERIAARQEGMRRNGKLPGASMGWRPGGSHREV